MFTFVCVFYFSCVFFACKTKVPFFVLNEKSESTERGSTYNNIVEEEKSNELPEIGNIFRQKGQNFQLHVNDINNSLNKLTKLIN